MSHDRTQKEKQRQKCNREAKKQKKKGGRESLSFVECCLSGWIAIAISGSIACIIQKKEIQAFAADADADADDVFNYDFMLAKQAVSIEMFLIKRDFGRDWID